MTECEHFSEDVKYWAEFKTGIRGFKPWLEASEKRAGGGLSKPQTLDEANAMYAQVSEFDQNALKHLKILENAVNELNSWVAQDRGAEQEQNFSLEKMESTLGELKNIFKEKERLVDNL